MSVVMLACLQKKKRQTYQEKEKSWRMALVFPCCRFLKKPLMLWIYCRKTQPVNTGLIPSAEPPAEPLCPLEKTTHLKPIMSILLIQQPFKATLTQAQPANSYGWGKETTP